MSQIEMFNHLNISIWSAKKKEVGTPSHQLSEYHDFATPANSMTALHFQNNMTSQLTPTPLNPMSALHFQNNTLPRQFGLFIASFPHMQITSTHI